MSERTLKYFERSPMRERQECEMQNFISFLMVLMIFENFEHFSLRGVETLTLHGNLFISKLFYQNCSFKGQLSLAGYALSSVSGELYFCLCT